LYAKTRTNTGTLCARDEMTAAAEQGAARQSVADATVRNKPPCPARQPRTNLWTTRSCTWRSTLSGALQSTLIDVADCTASCASTTTSGLCLGGVADSGSDAVGSELHRSFIKFAK
jgi:hypothetical protein